MKVCTNCQRVVLDRVEQCPECDGEDFEVILTSCYDDWESYLKEEQV